VRRRGPLVGLLLASCVAAQAPSTVPSTAPTSTRSPASPPEPTATLLEPARRVGTLALGGTPLGIAIAEPRARAFVRTKDAVIVVDTSPPGTIRTTIPLPDGVQDGVAYDESYGQAFATTTDGKIAVIAPQRQDLPVVVDTLATGRAIGALAADSRSHRLFALAPDALVVVNENTRRVVATLGVPGPAWGLAVNASTGRVFVVGDGAGPADSAYVAVYDADLLRQVTTVGVERSQSLALDTTHNVLYLGTLTEGVHYPRLTIFDARTAQASTFVWTTAALAMVAVNGQLAHLYVADERGNLSFAYGVPSGQATGTFGAAVSLGSPARVLAADPRQRLILAGLENGDFLMLDDRVLF